MRKYKFLYVIFSGLFILWMVMVYTTQPDTVILYKDRQWKTNSVSKFMNLDESIEASKGVIVPRKEGDYSASLSFLGIPYKSVTLKVVEAGKLCVGGQSIGIRLYSDSLVVVAVGRVNQDEKSPAESAGIKVGDEIVKINSFPAGTPDEFSEKIELSEGEVTLEIKRDGVVKLVTLTPERSKIDGAKRIGVWVRDSTAGVGTLTYMDPSTMTYGALGHPVSDSDTGVVFSVKKGSIEECMIGAITKGEKGAPGELKGIFYNNARMLGDIEKNKKEGIFGNYFGDVGKDAVEPGHKSEIKKGRAYIRTSLDGKEVRDYEIEILKVSPNSKNVAKGFIIKVTDEELIEKTGGIVQGMSGSPILQNGKLIGAVTHVLVNDPTKGYGIFIENMIQAGKS